MAQRPPSVNEPLRWLASNGHNLAPLTGTDRKALLAIAACWDLFAYTRSLRTLHAIQALLTQMQPTTAPITRDLIARSMDWSDRERYWPQVWGQQEMATVVVDGARASARRDIARALATAAASVEGQTCVEGCADYPRCSHPSADGAKT